ncbi:hypothetical protein P152DRAFT_514451 [Eremomyces bilateralis CBS 781.70]|uniref:G-patch domain-containing protein n=1 Tax=Eremomyces bilateralis CBS 781.70 TaxID=1392243 RepID=A0A6G1G2Z4_9PEZI|nr:uncharacterized protein P152DRAFT_514451 [Eremomyces bilateralis CBS 781.70]KAF1812301.1 hypothetical protein P152DRAFT_514451 [Eremomyces bilateralis CBS 781.70]
MDAEAYLKSHGWQGAGHSLDRTGRGIKKPLLISQKDNVLGLGKPKSLTSDQWWLRAFNDSLNDIGTGKQSALSQIREGGVRRGGLYGFFVKGESLHGTIHETSIEAALSTISTAAVPKPASADTSKRKRKAADSSQGDTRKRTKMDRTERAHLNDSSRKDETKSKDVPDRAVEQRQRKERKLNRRVKRLIKQEMAEGKYGLAPPHRSHSSDEAKAAKELKKEAKKAHMKRLWVEYFPEEKYDETGEEELVEEDEKREKKKKGEKEKKEKKEERKSKAPAMNGVLNLKPEEPENPTLTEFQASRATALQHRAPSPTSKSATRPEKRNCSADPSSRTSKKNRREEKPAHVDSSAALSTKQQKRYAARAAEKGMALETYIARREAKRVGAGAKGSGNGHGHGDITRDAKSAPICFVDVVGENPGRREGR